MTDVPARTSESDAMSQDLLKRGFKFVGSTICYALCRPPAWSTTISSPVHATQSWPARHGTTNPALSAYHMAHATRRWRFASAN